MTSFDRSYFNIGYLDRLSYRDTVIHRLDPRVKVIATLLFVVAVVSYPKYHIMPLLPFFAFPVLMAGLSDTPFLFIIQRVLIMSPFAVFIGIFNPVFDPELVSVGGGLLVRGGWISFLSIILKFTLTISATLLLIATTSFPGVCGALGRLGVPAVFTSQLLFLYRYIFVMMEEAMRIVRARDLRSFGSRGTGFRIFVRIVGLLFVRTIERAERIYNAMLCRAFQGNIRSLASYRISAADIVFLLGSAAAFALMRMVDITAAAGRLAQRFSA